MRKSNTQGGHKPGKHGKPGKLREFEKLSKSQGNLNFCGKNLNSGKMKNILHGCQQKCIQSNFPFEVLTEKFKDVLEI